MSAVRLRHVAQINPPTPEFDLRADDEDVTFLPLEAVWPGTSLDISRTRPKAEVSNGYTRFRENDVLVPKITPTFEANRSTIARGLCGGIGAGTTELHIVRPGPDLYVRYTNYLLASRSFLQGGKAAMKGVAGQQRVPDEWLRDFRVPVKEPTRQRAIADFLDAETARIDALIEKKRRLLDLLREGRHARSESLALGRAESGFPDQRHIEGPLKSVPAAWRFERNKTFLHEVADLSVDGSEELLSVSHLTGVTPRTEKNVTMFMAESLDGYKRVKAGDMVINTMWAWMGALGVSPVDGIVSPAYGVYRFDRQIAAPAYFDAVFRSSAYIAEMTRHSTGVWTSRLRLYPDKFLALRSPVPELSEQYRIAQAVQRQSEQTSTLADRLQLAIQLLNEHRQALITAAVTGEIEVPGAAAPS